MGWQMFKRVTYATKSGSSNSNNNVFLREQTADAFLKHVQKLNAFTTTAFGQLWTSVAQNLISAQWDLCVWGFFVWVIQALNGVE